MLRFIYNWRKDLPMSLCRTPIGAIVFHYFRSLEHSYHMSQNINFAIYSYSVIKTDNILRLISNKSLPLDRPR